MRPATPVLAQLVVTRRCNLTCGYCNEYDTISPPVAIGDLEARVDRLGALGTVALTLTGGEPLLHPELDAIVDRVVSRGMVCTTITNGYPVTRRWIDRLSEAKLSALQISIDNLVPNDLSEKSWRSLRPKLELLRDHAAFSVNVNAVLGACLPEQTRQVVREVRAMGFYMTVSLMHDDDGQLDPGLLGDSLAGLHDEMQRGSHKHFIHRHGEGWERLMIETARAPWKCRAGGRYLYVDEDGLVSYCSQRRGAPGIPLAEYDHADLQRAFDLVKGCEDRCTIGCVRRASAYDQWRAQRDVSSMVGKTATDLPSDA